MAEPEHNQLDDLFKKSDSGSLDDFEREALEGFNSLQSQQEAHDLQKKVEQRVQRELFAEEKKSRPFVYWYAAAGLFLVIGMSVYFILNKNDLNNKKNVAALEDISNVSNQPAQSAPIGNNQSQADERKGKARPETKSQLQTVTNDLQKEAKTVNRMTGPTDQKAAAMGGKSSENEGDLFKKAEGKESSAKALEQRSEPAMDNLAMAQPETEKTKEQIKRQDQNLNQNLKNNASSNAIRQENSGKEGADASNNVVMDDREAAKDEVMKAEKTQPSKEDVAGNKAKEKPDSRKKSSSQPAPGRAESGDIASKNADKDYKRDESKPAEEKSEATNGTFAGSGAASNSGNAAPVMTREAEAYYEGGENTLKKDLREKLKQNDVNKKFEATLFISDKKQVEKVSFTKSDLGKEQQEKIETVLKSLTKFNLREGKSKNGFSEYKLIYRP